jgi:hypothetical protein
LIWQVGGKPVDEIALTQSDSPSIVQPSVFKHIGSVGNTIGFLAGKFLQSKR